MRLLVVTQTLDKNDSNLGFFHEWVAGFSKKFDTVTVIALNVGSYDLPKNVTVHTLGKELGMGRVPRMMRYVALLVRLHREYTHVFAHMNPEYVIGGGWLWRCLGKKIGLWYVHGTVSLRLRIAEFFTNKIFTASSESCRIESRKIVVVGHGIDTEVFKPAGVSHLPAVLSVGRFSPSKRLEVLADAYALIKKEIPGISGTFAGDAGTSGEKEYVKTIHGKAATVGIEIVPPVPHADVPALLARADVFMNASATGSLDKAVLEAMSAGVVPVTSNVAFRAMLSPLGLFVEARAEEFAKVAVRLFREVGTRERLAKNVRSHIEEHHSFRTLMNTLYSAFEAL